ncbi:PREDICTED: uncharacterized protein LOC109221708 [Nicotiana attenuata]|uniref:uncharacterized protein LOC109221708 n=1 Tax=Nicotiana attenuata TaxID=49451 RepID=UPI000904AF1C|nr:PREDICTED: uncharacterized protein LOC109221708 [Nicotiana attenuata]
MIPLPNIKYTEPSSSNAEALLSENGSITLSPEDKERMYMPWQYSIIIRLQGKRILHQTLKRKVEELWKLNDSFPLIDLGSDYYIAKLRKAESMNHVLQKGPWFVFGFFLSCQKWKPNFVAANAKQICTAVWIRLPNLLTEFYDKIILQRIGNSIGRLLKVDACTFSTLRGRYARLCVELPLNKPVDKFIVIDEYKQIIEYEGDKLLCKTVGP